MSAASTIDPHNTMRGRDVNKVARGEQAPRPPHEFGTVSPPPQNRPNNKNDQKKVDETDSKTGYDPHAVLATETRHCYPSYVEYQRCIREKGKDADACEKLEKVYQSLCPKEWIERWDRERELGTFHDSTI